MHYLLSFWRRVAWLVLFSYVIIFAAELIILLWFRNLPQANTLRYLVLFGAITLNVWLIYARIIRPLHAMRHASHHIADGHYDQRLPHYTSIELDELAQDFNRMAATLQDIEQQRVALIGNVAHELRTPLGNIRATMEGLIDGIFEPNPATLLSIQREVSRLQRLVHQLEELSRAESGSVALHKQPVNLNHLIDDVCARLQVQYDDKNVMLQINCSPNLPMLQLDPDRMTQILINILGNALQYTPAGGSVAVSCEHNEQQIEIRVNDSGVGIAPEHLPRVFERFYRVDKSRSRASGGNGIGLTIAKHLALAHGGDLLAESAGIGEGATFILRLPLTQ